jgi:RHS repeat-associated protein
VQKVGPSDSTVYIYDALGRLAAEYAAAAGASQCSTCYLTRDMLGTPRLVTDQSGSLVAWHDYLPFGEEIAANTAGRNNPPGALAGVNFWGAGADTINQKFTGQERDAESGLDWFKTRYYGSALGRFTSPDPIGIMKQKLLDPQQWNMYGYARNNPLRFTDPTGMYVANCGGDVKNCDKQIKNFDNALQQALKSKNQNVVDAAKAYGALGDKNGVNVSILKVVDAKHSDVTGQPALRLELEGRFLIQPPERLSKLLRSISGRDWTAARSNRQPYTRAYTSKIGRILLILLPKEAMAITR